MNADRPGREPSESRRSREPRLGPPKTGKDHLAVPPAPAVGLLNAANAMTLLRMALVPVFIALLFNGAAWAALIVFLVASFTDLLDGELARRRGLVTDFGKVADPIADKALTGAALVSLSVLSELPWWVTIVIFVREIGITLLRFSVIRHGVIPASYGGKIKTVLQMLAIALYVAPIVPEEVRWPVMLLAVVFTVATGVDYVIRAWRLSRRHAGAE